MCNRFVSLGGLVYQLEAFASLPKQIGFRVVRSSMNRPPSPSWKDENSIGTPSNSAAFSRAGTNEACASAIRSKES